MFIFEILHYHDNVIIRRMSIIVIWGSQHTSVIKVLIVLNLYNYIPYG